MPDVEQHRSTEAQAAARVDSAGSGQPAETTQQPLDADQQQPAGGADQQQSAHSAEQDRWRRAAADADNARKRAVRELGRIRDAERAEVASGFLPVLDNLDLALSHAEADPAAIIEGIRAVRDQAVAILARLGYERHDQTGMPFDPAAHEVVAVVENPAVPGGTVVGVLRPGYGNADRQLRPAGVAVTSRPE